MSFLKKAFSKKGVSKWTRRVLLGLDRKQWKKVRNKIGLTSKNKWVRSLKRSFGGSSSVLSPSAPVSASTYQYQSRPISSLM